MYKYERRSRTANPSRPFVLFRTALAFSASLIGCPKTVELAAVFETLANDTRLRALNVIAQSGEASPTDLAEKVGMKPQAISNQLKRLSDRGIIERRREGNQVYYRIVDPCAIRSAGTRLMAYTRHKASQGNQEEGGALLSVSWSRPCLEMVVNFQIRALRYADL